MDVAKLRQTRRYGSHARLVAGAEREVEHIRFGRDLVWGATWRVLTDFAAVLRAADASF